MHVTQSLMHHKHVNQLSSKCMSQSGAVIQCRGRSDAVFNLQYSTEVILPELILEGTSRSTLKCRGRSDAVIQCTGLSLACCVQVHYYINRLFTTYVSPRHRSITKLSAQLVAFCMDAPRARAPGFQTRQGDRPRVLCLAPLKRFAPCNHLGWPQ